MASRGSPPRKRRSSERGRERDHEPRKKRKGSSSSSTREKLKSSKKKSSKESKSSSLKVRTVAELAALVSSGAVRVPQSLQHYISDHTQLLDQVFTILSPEDVSGMLPDVLKGLKMKQIKQLCLKKLQSMRDEDIVSVIEADDSSLESDLNSTLTRLIGSPSTSCSVPRPVKHNDGGGGQSEKSEKTIDIAVSDISEDEMKKDLPNKPQIVTNTQDPHKNSSKTGSSEERSAVSKDDDCHVKQREGERDKDSSDSEQEDLSGVNQLLEMELRQRALESALKKASTSQPTETQSDVSVKTAAPVNTKRMKEPTSEEVSNTVTSVVSHDSMSQGGVSHDSMSDQGGVSHDSMSQGGVSHDNMSQGGVGEMLEQRLREKLLQSLAIKRK